MRRRRRICALAVLAVASTPLCALAQSGSCAGASVSNDAVVGAVQNLTPALSQAQCPTPTLPGDAAREAEYDPDLPSHMRRAFEAERREASMSEVTTSNWLVQRFFGSTSASASRLSDDLSNALSIGLLSVQVLTDLDLAQRYAPSSSEMLRWVAMDVLAHGLAQAFAAMGRELGERDPEEVQALGCADPNDPECLYGIRPSARATLGFTSAALTCLHQQMEGGEVSHCLGSVAMAVTLGAVRALSDEHEFQDVALSAGIGLVSGYLLPLVTFYAVGQESRGARSSEPPSDFQAWISPTFSTSGFGLRAVGTF